MIRKLMFLTLAIIVGALCTMARAQAQTVTTSNLNVLSPILMTEATVDQTKAPVKMTSTWGQLRQLYRGDGSLKVVPQRGVTTQSVIGPYTPYPTGWKFPFSGTWTITCKYGCGYHTGNDYYSIDWSRSGAYGQPVLAPATGNVIFRGNQGCYGNTVIVDAGNGWFYRVAHLSAFSVWPGYINQGQYIGYCGSTGCSSGAHIHFTVYFPARWDYTRQQLIQIGNNQWGSGMSVPQEGISNQWSLQTGGWYNSGW